MTIDREHVLEALRAKRDEIEERYGVRMIGLIGSVARGSATEGSDIDIVAEVTGRPSLFNLVQAEEDLKGAVGTGLPVELVFWEGMRPSGRAIMERDLVPL